MSPSSSVLADRETFFFTGSKIPAPIVPSYPHLLHSNNIPSIIEAATVQSDVELLDREGAMVAEELAEATTYLDRIRAVRDRLQMARHRQNILLSPIRRLPPGILEKIFLNCLGELELCYTNPPWTCSHVCRQWRTVALATPELWSTIVTPMYPDENNVAISMKRIELMLQRSGLAPLTIEWQPHHYHGRNAHATSLSLLQLLVPHSHRWHSLKLKLPNDARLLQTLKGLVGRLPNLRFLRIFAFHDIGSSIKEFAADSKLETLHMSGNQTLLKLQLSVRHLRHLTIQSEASYPVWEYLQGAEELRSLKISHIWIAPSESLKTKARSKRLCLPRLTHLTIHSFPLDMLDYFTCPSLEVLEFKAYYRYKKAPFGPDLCNFLRRTRRNIRSFTLNDFPALSDQTMRGIVKALPAVEHLNISNSQASCNAFFEPQGRADTGGSFPCLTQLDLYRCQAAAEILLDFIEERVAGSSPTLQKVSIGCMSRTFPQGSEESARLRKLVVEHGLRYDGHLEDSTIVDSD
ncbi:hypothetical protein HGRIS_000272 [Hohenbuehelia grisea]|uniref:F-box domain-containing protein n=1 Tax=Hohenbuehelia grisea TaxID=104357 RepID=A0ABR3JRC2_9AGAR